MLEVKNLTFKVKENGIDRSIVEDISFTVENGEMLVITGPNGEGSLPWRRCLWESRRQIPGRLSWMVRISALMILTIGQMRESAMHFSSRPGLKE